MHSQETTAPEAPLVSVLIPAYNRPYLLTRALESVLLQSYTNLEIVICDDSTDGQVEQTIQPYLLNHKHIRYYRNAVNLGAENWHRLMDLAQGEFINFLMDDDLFHPLKIEKMVAFFLQSHEITLVTSFRQMIDEQGRILPDEESTRMLYQQTITVNGTVLGDHVLQTNTNVIGEPTTVLFRKSDLKEKFGYYHGEFYPGLNDIASWLLLLERGKAVYLAEPLSYFRQHAGQNQKKSIYVTPTLHQWVTIIREARKHGFLNEELAYKRALTRHLGKAATLLTNIVNGGGDSLLDEKVATALSQCVRDIVLHTDPFFCSFCQRRYRRFHPWPDEYDSRRYRYEMWNKDSAICPGCGSLDRERLFRLYLEKAADIRTSALRVLHIAPEEQLRNWFTSMQNISYVCGDLNPPDASVQKVDIMRMPYVDESFDIVVCSHVLEHVPDDLAAIREIRRVMRPGGTAILQVPVALNLRNTFSDPTVLSPDERRDCFGQKDHVRMYGTDYPDRIRTGGLSPAVINAFRYLGPEVACAAGLSERDNLYIGRKEG